MNALIMRGDKFKSTGETSPFSKQEMMTEC
jgi:hypothetical protein